MRLFLTDTLNEADRPSRNPVATKSPLGPSEEEQFGRHPFGYPRGIKRKAPSGPMNFLMGAAMLDAFNAPLVSGGQ